ncbi:hypothetical protein BH10PSE13_BH10PSE13_16230 [soil metagenome]
MRHRRSAQDVEGFWVMAERKGDAEHKLRDYPISLRESARAVFGDSYACAERHTSHAVVRETIRPKRG